MKRKCGFEYIKVCLEYKNGELVCICNASNKRCDKDCKEDVVKRDRYVGWEDTFRVDKYGKSKF